MLDQTILLLLIVASIGAGGILGLISLIVMAVELAKESGDV